MLAVDVPFEIPHKRPNQYIERCVFHRAGDFQELLDVKACKPSLKQVQGEKSVSRDNSWEKSVSITWFIFVGAYHYNEVTWT